MSRSLLLIVVLLSILYELRSITVRVRLPSGLIHRVDVNEETSINDFVGDVDAKSFLSSNATFLLGNIKMIKSESSNEKIISKWKLKHGDIVEIKDKSSSKQGNESCIANESSMQTNINQKLPAAKKNISLQNKIRNRKKTMSDIMSRRQNLVKISPEKSNNKAVFVSMTTGRVLKRLSNGGIGIALGKIIKNIETKSAKRQKPNDLKKSSNKDATVHYEIHNICEIVTCESDEDTLMWDIQSSYESKILKIQSLAKKLGLSIVGTVVGIPLKSKSLGWSYYHVHSLLQLQTILNEKNLLGISVYYPDKDESKLIEKKALRRKLWKNPSLDFSVEAFVLSNQTYILYDSSILPAIPLNPVTIRRTKDQKEEDILKNQLINVNTTEDVKLQTNEVSSFDALLLAVPLPMKTLTTALTYEHSFPSTCEMQADKKMMLLAKKHVLRILGSTNNEETIKRLRDPHLLLYLSDIIDDMTLTALCQGLTKESIGGKLPQNIVAALELIKMVLD